MKFRVRKYPEYRARECSTVVPFWRTSGLVHIHGFDGKGDTPWKIKRKLTKRHR